MPTNYLLPCACGKTIDVGPSQAGGTVVCKSCGASVEVPRLGQLRELPTTEKQEMPTAWGFRQGALTACLLAAAACGAASVWLTVTEPEPLQPIDMAAYLNAVDQNVGNLSPAQGYEMWLKGYQPLAGLGFVDPNEKYSEALEQAIATRRLYRNGLIGTAVIALIAGVAAGVVPGR